ncbi:MAG: hypothetical protein EA393_11925 [Bacteroidetes bacterium]|nr:MAG: hypothetical protein EA393_11925 [Bacteroidota bacterium]
MAPQSKVFTKINVSQSGNNFRAGFFVKLGGKSFYKNKYLPLLQILTNFQDFNLNIQAREGQNDRDCRFAPIPNIQYPFTIINQSPVPPFQRGIWPA